MNAKKVEQKVISMRAALPTFYFKVGQAFFQSGAETVISRWVNVYFKVGQLFQSEAVTSKWGKVLFQSGAVISKWGITPLTLSYRYAKFSAYRSYGD